MPLQVYRAHILAEYYYQITLCKHRRKHVSLERNANVLVLH